MVIEITDKRGRQFRLRREYSTPGASASAELFDEVEAGVGDQVNFPSVLPGGDSRFGSARLANACYERVA